MEKIEEAVIGEKPIQLDRKPKKLLWLWILLGAIIILLICSISFVYGKEGSLSFSAMKKAFSLSNEAAVNSSSTPTPETTAISAATASPSPTATPTSTADSTKWITPVKLGDLALFNQPKNNDYEISQTEYYKVADLDSGKEMILAVLIPNTPSGDVLVRFTKNSSGVYTYLAGASEDIDLETTVVSMLKETVLNDYSTKFSQLTAPAVLITDKGYKLTSGHSYITFFSELTKPEKVEDSVYGSVYQTLASPEGVTAFSNRTLYLKHGDSTVTGYVIDGQMIATSAAVFNLNNGAANTDEYYPVTGLGCGSPTPAALLTDSTNIKSRLTPYGTTPTGGIIYHVSSASDSIVTEAYKIYETAMTNSDQAKLPVDQYFAKSPLILWQDVLGSWNVYTKSGYTLDGGCGKPVVYLYPTKTTQVSVKVGANVTVSEPEYGDGWTATAKPSGELTVNGKAYPYLFWEGKGNGEYPIIDAGFVVKQSELKTTLEKQLSQLGLTVKESADFMEYWMPLMPSTPYVKLSWLGTQAMNELAPLTISPKPDTMIRIFLDFQGLDKQIFLKPQRLSAPAREGFTVVEWGGLLKDMK